MASCTRSNSVCTFSISASDSVSPNLLPSSSLRSSRARVGATAFFDVAAHVLGFVEARLLRHEADAKPSAARAVPRKSLSSQGHDAQQRALAGAVAADDADLGAGIEGQPDVLEHLALAVGFAEVFDREDVLFAHALEPILFEILVALSLVFGRRSVKGDRGPE